MIGLWISFGLVVIIVRVEKYFHPLPEHDDYFGEGDVIDHAVKID